MKLGNCGLVLQILFCAMLTSSHFGCGGSSASSSPISVSVSPSSATVQANATQQFTATVTNDASNKGVTWTILCSATPCGSVSPTSTASGAATTYTAPATLSSSENVTITATSVASSSASAQASVTLPSPPQIQIALSTDESSVNPGGTAHLYANVLNDPTSSGVRWSLTCTPVQSSCGSVSPTTTQSGSPATYTAPSTVPLAGLSVNFTATAVADSSISNSGTISVLGVTVSVAPAKATVDFNGTHSFAATVANDPNNSGVTWTVSCSPSPCGTLSASTTASAAPTTYTAPATPPTSDLSVTITATSITFSGAFASATITIPAITVSSSPATALLPLTTSQQYVANVGNDSNKQGVSWSLSQNGSACSPACGTLTPANTASGSATTYTAPTTMPSSSTVTITATSVTDGTKSSSDTATLSSGTVELVPYSLDFGRVLVGTSASLPVTVTNTGSAGLSIGTIGVVAAATSEFSQTNTCNSSVSAGGSCAITATFAPTKVGTVSGSISISDSSSDSPQQVNMSGTGYTKGEANSAALRLALSNAQIIGAPIPTGTEKVGTRVLHFVDRTRPDPFLHNGATRELMVRFWYPASLADACEPAEYASPSVWDYFGQLLGMRLPQVLTNSCLNAPVQEGTHAIVVFTHGYTGTFTDYTFIFEDLASRGYVVASVDHTYEATAVEFPAGKLVKSKLGSHFANTWHGDEKTLAFATSVRLDDLHFVLNQIGRLNASPDSAFSGKLDVSRIAIAGHSMGGATALLALQRDERFRAAVILDGVLPPSLIRTTQSPVMILNTSRPKTSTDQCVLWNSLRGPRLYLSLDGAEHLTPSDALWLAPGGIAAGSIGTERTVAMIRDSVAAFLDSNLRERLQDRLPSSPSLNKFEVNQSSGDQLKCLP